MSHVLRGRYFLLSAAHLVVAVWGVSLSRRGAFDDLRGAGSPFLAAAAVALPLLVAWILLLRGCTRVHQVADGLEVRDPRGRLHLLWETLRLVQIDSGHAAPARGRVLFLPGSARPTALRIEDFAGLASTCESCAEQGLLRRWS